MLAVSGQLFGMEITSSGQTGLLRSFADPYPADVSAQMLLGGLVTSQGDLTLNADLARDTYGITGAGVKVGIISDSFDFLGGYAGGVSSGDLPGLSNPANILPVTILQDDFGIDEGRGMAEIIYDVAPGAELFFHAAFVGGNQAYLAGAIDNLVAAGVDAIVDDVGFLNEPYFQDGLIAQAVNRAHDAGVVYLSSAGNSSDQGYMGTFNAFDVGGGVSQHNFDLNNSEGGDTRLNISVPAGRQARVTIQWSDPYKSVGGPPGAKITDFDAGLWVFATESRVNTSTRTQKRNDPWELPFV